MTDYLHLRCGDCELLLDIGCVEAVDFIGESDCDSSGRRLWRDRLLPVLDLPATLGRAGANRQMLVVRDGGQCCLVEVSEILGLRQVAEAEWQALVTVSAEAERFFDRALAVENGRCLLRLRQPLPWFSALA